MSSLNNHALTSSVSGEIKMGTLPIVVSASIQDSFDMAEKMAKEQAAAQGFTITGLKLIERDRWNGVALYTRNLVVYVFNVTQVSKFVSVSLTPEARDALKAEAIKQIGETGVNLTMSDALLAVLKAYRADEEVGVGTRLRDLEYSVKQLQEVVFNMPES